MEIGIGFRFGVGIADGNITGIGIGFGIIAKLTGFGIKKSTGIGFGIVEGGFTPGLIDKRAKKDGRVDG